MTLERKASKWREAHPWSYELEEQVAHQISPDLYCDFTYPGDDDPLGWEIWYYQGMQCKFLAEVAAYKRLHSLQGLQIPRCYGSGRLVLADRAFLPPIVLLEYIPDAVSLKEMAIKPDQSLIASLVTAVDAFGGLGVMHNNLIPTNILFHPYDAPTRAVIIYFARASSRRDDESDEEWNEAMSWMLASSERP